MRFSVARRMAAITSLALVFAGPVLLAGCGGGRGLAPQNIGNNDFGGVYDGEWSAPSLGQRGVLDTILITQDGQVYGRLINATTGAAGDVSGGAGINGQFYANVDYSGQDDVRIEGRLVKELVRVTQGTDAQGRPQQVDKAGLRAAFRQKINGTTYQGEFLLISREAGTPVSSTTSGG